ncbi:hypothetical protein CC1G_00278 [Coprinopsis cinerea okayama7|uniref:Actin cytoskeleton-regulatory complex protein SLA1 n=1 Tax=Coprinopsis cinerea (strain Okayama-7 / 130 / ATCC MYA-4618 / FGSC 9003) TaxID=240176 RepID=A8NXE2_COPC7|nr:hypothetical protein CC1G_00278 [Coprinopsis cinerea okayama7\|eukprot:XP_001837142.2 hypothetical protein CC1G_00278 [Coprinopsis cinerea okayama7\
MANTTEPETYLAVLKASYDYDPQSSDEVAIKEDQVLFLVERTDEDWWKVKVKGDSQDDDGPVGLVPAAYVEQAEHSSLVKVLYDYDAAAPGELSVKEDDILRLFETDGDWILAQSHTADGAGYVPGNYVEDTASDDQPEPTTASHIVIPDSPPRPVSTYIDPADRVASHKITADDIKTWSVSEIDKKGKKKKGTLGIGNGSLFFASESDKAAVQKWQTSDVLEVSSDKAKHVQIEVGGPNPVSLHFHAGSKDNAEEIIAKTESSKSLSTTAPSGSPSTPRRLPPAMSSGHKDGKQKSNVTFDSAPQIIPPAPAVESDDEDIPQQHEQEFENATALYDFTADGDDELSVSEGERLVVLERDSDDWWKCRNMRGQEGVVPASYLELIDDSQSTGADNAEVRRPVEEEEERRRAEEEERQERERAEREEAERLQREEQLRKKEEASRLQKEEVLRKKKEAARLQEEEALRKKREAQEKARVAAAEAERQRRKEARKICCMSLLTIDASPPASVTSPSKSTSSNSKKSQELTRSYQIPIYRFRQADFHLGPPPDKTRIWHDRTGQFRVEAAFLGFNNGKLRLHKVNGVIVEVPAEKMSVEDMRHVEKLMAKKQRGPNGVLSDDDVPLGVVAGVSSRPPAVPKKKAPTIDWFDFFLSAGCDVDDCTKYASAFERDKIDETLLTDITDSTMRSLGLREGDIIRVKKAIEKRKPTDNLIKPSPYIQEQIKKDEELARQLQAQENQGRKTPPNLFAAGPGGALKANVRRGRPQPKGTLPLDNVDIRTLSNASDAIQRTSSPQTAAPNARPSSTPAVEAPPRSSSATVPASSGFEDDAWAPRPSSAKPSTTAATATTPRAPSAPPAQETAPQPTATTTAPTAQVTSAPTAPAPPPPAASTSPKPLAQTTENDIFQQLERLKNLRTTASPPAQQMQQPTVTASPPIVQNSASFPVSAGMGMGHSPVPMGQISQQQPSLSPAPSLNNGPRGPFAPVPANQGLLQPLIPTQTGFNSFVPTRPPAFNNNPSPAPQLNTLQPMHTSLSPSSMSPMLPQQTGMLMGNSLVAQPTGMPMNQGLMSQPTGMPMNQGLLAQPTGMPMNNGFGLQNSSGFGQLQPNPTGFNPSMNSGNFNNFSNIPPVPPLPSTQVKDTSPASVFASMKSGTFEDESAPRSADVYDPFRNPLQAQPTGWMGQGYGQGGMGFR